jgi:TrmH family RNA methyltransferase
VVRLARRLFISSISNPRLKAVRRLARSSSQELLLAEGARSLHSALAAGARVREVYVSPELFLGREDAPLVDRAERAGARVHEVEPRAFRTIARNVRPDGVLALVERPASSLERLALPTEPFVVVAVGVERPGNLGAIVRTACAANADAVVVADASSDVYRRDVVRSSVGTIFRLPVVSASGSQTLRWLRRRGLRLVAATPAGAVPYWQGRYLGGVAVALGSERHGLGAEWLAAADETVAIPMPGPADSLNVGVAAGIVLFEATRRRTCP